MSTQVRKPRADRKETKAGEDVKPNKKVVKDGVKIIEDADAILEKVDEILEEVRKTGLTAENYVQKGGE